jgi:hypothetical protein
MKLKPAPGQPNPDAPAGPAGTGGAAPGANGVSPRQKNEGDDKAKDTDRGAKSPSSTGSSAAEPQRRPIAAPKPQAAPEKPSADWSGGDRRKGAPPAPRDALVDPTASWPEGEGPRVLVLDGKGFHVAAPRDADGFSGGTDKSFADAALISSAVTDASDPAVRALALHALDLEAQAQPHDVAWARRVLKLGDLLGLAAPGVEIEKAAPKQAKPEMLPPQAKPVDPAAGAR